MAKWDAVIERIDWPQRALLTAIIQLAVFDIRNGNRHAQQAQFFLVSNVFCFLCQVLGLNKSDIQRALLPADFIAQEGWRESEPMLEIAPPQKGRPRKHTSATSAYIRRIEQEQQQKRELSDAELFGIQFMEDSEPITYTHTFNSRSI